MSIHMTERQQVGFLLARENGSNNSNTIAQRSSSESPRLVSSGANFLCAICDKPEGEEALYNCSECPRFVHQECYGLTHESQWTCSQCKNPSECFYCGKPGQLYPCKIHRCGRMFHWECIKRISLAKIVNPNTKRFFCSLHYCFKCKLSGDGRQSVHCFRCPTAYHLGCLPSTVSLPLERSKSRRSCFIVCNHHDDGSEHAPQARKIVHDAIDQDIDQSKSEAEQSSEESNRGTDRIVRSSSQSEEAIAGLPVELQHKLSSIQARVQEEIEAFKRQQESFKAKRHQKSLSQFKRNIAQLKLERDMRVQRLDKELVTRYESFVSSVWE